MIRSLLCALLLTSPLNAAAPITHAYFAHLWNDIHSSHEIEPFIAGNLFPDIRYQGCISRKATHERHLTAKQIKNTENPIRSGMRLHAFVDEKREAFIAKCHVMRHLQEIPEEVRVLFLKLLEDEILYNKHHWNETQNGLLTIYDEQLKTGIPQENIENWHATMHAYFSQSPSDLLKNLAAGNQPFLKADPETVALWCEILPLYAEDPYFLAYVDRMTRHVAHLFN